MCSDTNYWGIPSPPCADRGCSDICSSEGKAHWHNILRGSAKPPTSTGESHCIRYRETWSRRITSAALTAAAIAALSFSLLTLTFSLTILFALSLLCSQIIASFIGKHGEPLQHICQHGGVNKALNQATISGTNGATTCLVVGYCHKWQYPNKLLSKLDS
jgi:hypothetical protein